MAFVFAPSVSPPSISGTSKYYLWGLGGAECAHLTPYLPLTGLFWGRHVLVLCTWRWRSAREGGTGHSAAVALELLSLAQLGGGGAKPH